MSKVLLKLSPSIAGMLNTQGSDPFVLEREIEEGITISDLLTDLASSEPDFRKVVFNPDVGKVSEQIHVILNGNLLQFPDVPETKLNDGDNLVLIPVYYGG